MIGSLTVSDGALFCCDSQAGMARVRSQEDVTETDRIRRRKRSKVKSLERKRMDRRWRQRWRQQKPENVSSNSFFT